MGSSQRRRNFKRQADLGPGTVSYSNVRPRVKSVPRIGLDFRMIRREARIHDVIPLCRTSEDWVLVCRVIACRERWKLVVRFERLEHADAQ
jgi:hypothetical protein